MFWITLLTLVIAVPALAVLVGSWLAVLAEMREAAPPPPPKPRRPADCWVPGCTGAEHGHRVLGPLD